QLPSSSRYWALIVDGQVAPDPSLNVCSTTVSSCCSSGQMNCSQLSSGYPSPDQSSHPLPSMLPSMTRGARSVRLDASTTALRARFDTHSFQPSIDRVKVRPDVNS